MKKSALKWSVLCLAVLFAGGCGGSGGSPSSVTGTGKLQEAETGKAAESQTETSAEETASEIKETEEVTAEAESEVSVSDQTEALESESTAKVDKAVFDAYLDELMTHEDSIRRVSWQNKYTIGWLDDISTKYGKEPIAITDICGDDTPELIYLSAKSDYTADLNILTYEGGSLRTVLSSENYDIQVAGGARFILFKKNDGKDLYSYFSMGDENWTTSWAVLEPRNSGQYTWHTLAREETGPNEDYTSTWYDYSDQYGTITKEEFDDTARDLRGNMDYVVLCENIDDQAIYDKSAQLDYLAMSFDEATGFLEGTWTPEDRSDDWADRDSDPAPDQASEPQRDSDPAPADNVDSSPSQNGSLYEGMIFPDSDSRYLTSGDIKGLSSSEIQSAINEIYARHGYVFKDSDILAKYSSYSWYHKVEDNMEVVSRYFNAYEMANVEFLISNK